MVLKQVNIFGECKEIVKKTGNKEKHAKKINFYKIRQKIELLYKLYEELYNRQNISILEPRDVIIKGNIIIYPEDRQAEPVELINLTLYDIDEKIEKMKKVLEYDKI